MCYVSLRFTYLLTISLLLNYLLIKLKIATLTFKALETGLPPYLVQQLGKYVLHPTTPSVCVLKCFQRSPQGFPLQALP